jgi:WD40 repeat protein
VDDGRSVIRCSIHTGVVRWKLRESKDGRYEFAEPTVLDPETGWVLSDRLPGARRLAFVDPRAGRVRIAELESDRFRVHAIWDVPGVYSVAFHPSGDQIFVHGVELEKPDPASPRLQVRRVSDGTIVATPAAPASGEVIWSADGSVVLTSNGTIESYLWDPATWKPRAKLTGSLGGNSTTFGLSPDGRYAVVLSDQKVQLLSTRDGTLMVAFDAPEAVGMAAAVRFLPDRSRFAVLWRDGRVDIVDPTQWTDGLSRLGMDWQ